MDEIGSGLHPRARFIFNIVLYSGADTNVLCSYHAVNMLHFEARVFITNFNTSSILLFTASFPKTSFPGKTFRLKFHTHPPSISLAYACFSSTHLDGTKSDNISYRVQLV
jgi:hypothetical protein